MGVGMKSELGTLLGATNSQMVVKTIRVDEIVQELVEQWVKAEALGTSNIYEEIVGGDTNPQRKSQGGDEKAECGRCWRPAHISGTYL